MMPLFRSERASALAELTLILPLLLLLLLGTIDLGLGVRTYLTLIDAAYEGARWLATHPSDLSGAQTRIVTTAGQAGVLGGALTVTFTPAASSYQPGDTVTVTLEHNHPLLFGALTSLPTLPIRTQATMRVLYE
jgi:Flp pilus assembly protein TadG